MPKANSSAHTKWLCKYHIVFTPKYRRKIIFNQYKKDLAEILHDLCAYISKRNSEYATYAAAYPVFYKYKILLPVLFVYRAVRAVFNGRLWAELSALHVVGKKKTY